MYAQKAIETLKKINNLSIDKNIELNHHYIFSYNGKRYTYNVDYIDNKDESITGYIMGIDRHDYIVSKDNFKIDSDGNITQKGVFRNFALSRKIIKESKK